MSPFPSAATASACEFPSLKVCRQPCIQTEHQVPQNNRHTPETTI